MFSVLLLSVKICCSQDVIDNFLQTGWEIEEIKDKSDTFFLINNEGIKSTLMLSHSTIFEKEELEYDNYIKIHENSIKFLEQEYKQKHMDYGYKTIDILGDSYKGVAFIVDPHEDFLQCHIFLTNGSQEYWGMFNGSNSQWFNVLKILKKKE